MKHISLRWFVLVVALIVSALSLIGCVGMSIKPKPDVKDVQTRYEIERIDYVSAGTAVYLLRDKHDGKCASFLHSGSGLGLAKFKDETDCQ